MRDSHAQCVRGGSPLLLIIMKTTLVLENHGYTWKKKLGEGRFGQVVCAYSTRKRRNFAIKIIDTKKSDSSYLEKFLSREKDIIISVMHPNIVRTLEIFQQNKSKVFLVMELCENGNVSQYIQTKGPLSEDVSCRFFTQMCEAVQYLHGNEVAHRDLKCENLLLDNFNNLKVCDFSLSKRLRYKDNKMELSTTFCGTPHYAPPEILRSCPYNPKVSDVWSMGVVLYIMLYAAPPFDSSNIKKMVQKQNQHNIFFPNTPSVSLLAKELIERILHPVAEHRMTISNMFNSAWMSQRKDDSQSSTPDLCSGKDTGENSADAVPLQDDLDQQEGPSWTGANGTQQ